MVKLDAGRLPLPRLWKGPVRDREIGPLSVLDPDGFAVRLKVRLPLETLCEPLKVSLRSVCGSAEVELLLLPHAATATALITSKISAAPRRPIPILGCMQLPPHRDTNSRANVASDLCAG